MELFWGRQASDAETIWKRASDDLREALRSLDVTAKKLQEVSEEHRELSQRMLDALKKEECP
jgi:DUF438 domain-containing protein